MSPTLTERNPSERPVTKPVWGYFYAERYGLVGHDSGDVMRWLAAHPDYRGSIGFDYGDGSDEVDVTEQFFPEPEEVDAEAAAWVASIGELVSGREAA